MNDIFFGNQDADVIVVGSGPGGATVAKELACRQKKVLMVEWGDNDPLTNSFWYGVKTLLTPGKSLLLTGQLLGMVRGITTGGSTVHYYATCYPVPFEMLKSHGVDIAREVAQARKELPVAYRVKWSARMYVEDALAHGAQLINGARVKKVIIDNGGAVGVEFVRNSKPFKVFAPTVVVSAGGIGSAVILRASGIKRAGTNFFFDPLIGVRGTVGDIDVPDSEIPMSAGVHLQDEGYMMTDMSHPAATTAFFAAGVLRFDKMFSRRNTLQIMVKARDELGGRLTDSGGVRKNLDKNEKQKLLRGYERARAILKKAGAKNIFKTGYLAAHPGGTVKIGDLVDANLKTEYDNLYVCDCSVIPEAWFRNKSYWMTTRDYVPGDAFQGELDVDGQRPQRWV